MTRRNKRALKTGVPYLTAAFFCERTIEDKTDNAISAIRLTDRINIVLDPSAPPDFPSAHNRLPVAISGLVSFRTGGSPGEHTIRLEMMSPTGKTGGNVFKQTFSFGNEPYSGVNVRLNAVIGIKKGGLFLMNVYLDDELFTRVPLEILVQRSEQPLTEVARAHKVD